MFGLSQGQTNYWVHYLTPILKQVLGDEKQLPAHKTTDLAQVLVVCPGLESIIGETEWPRQRLKDNKRHTVIYLGVTQFTFPEAELEAIWLDYAHLLGLKPASGKVFRPN